MRSHGRRPSRPAPRPAIPVAVDMQDVQRRCLVRGLQKQCARPPPGHRRAGWDDRPAAPPCPDSAATARSPGPAASARSASPTLRQLIQRLTLAIGKTLRRSSPPPATRKPRPSPARLIVTPSCPPSPQSNRAPLALTRAIAPDSVPCKTSGRNPPPIPVSSRTPIRSTTGPAPTAILFFWQDYDLICATTHRAVHALAARPPHGPRMPARAGQRRSPAASGPFLCARGAFDARTGTAAPHAAARRLSPAPSPAARIVALDRRHIAALAHRI